MFAERTLPDSSFAPFGGWQIYAMAAGFGFVLVTLLVGSAGAVRRRYRALGVRTPHRRTVLIAAFLPGAFLGALLGDPMASAVSWASNHTAAAHHARSERSRLLAEGRKGPPAPATGGAAAAQAIAALLLQPSDLGDGWYEGQQPMASEAPVRATEGMYGATLAIQTRLQQAQWTGAAWLPRHVIGEELLRFRSVDDGGRYLRTIADRSSSLVDGVSVYERGLSTSAPSRSAEFLVGADLFSITIDVTTAGTPTPSDFAALVDKAVQRATDGR
jgi:hypothetical protein